VSDKFFVIIKNGLYWRPNSRGYTSSRMEAGFYTEQEAKEVCDHPNSSSKYKPVSDLFETEDEVNAIISNLERIIGQMQLQMKQDRDFTYQKSLDKYFKPPK